MSDQELYRKFCEYSAKADLEIINGNKLLIYVDETEEMRLFVGEYKLKTYNVGQTLAGMLVAAAESAFKQAKHIRLLSKVNVYGIAKDIDYALSLRWRLTLIWVLPQVISLKKKYFLIKHLTMDLIN